MSTKLEMLAMVRKLISDEQATGFTEGGNLEEPEGTQELENYLDRAVDTYSKQRVAMHDPMFMKKLIPTDGARLPDDFLGFAGSVPVMLEEGKIRYYGEITDFPIRYFARLPYVTAYDDEADLPYDHDVYITLCAMAAIYALNKHEFNVSQDLQLLAYGGSFGGATNGAANNTSAGGASSSSGGAP